MGAATEKLINKVYEGAIEIYEQARMAGNLEALDYCDIVECYKKAKKIVKMPEKAEKAVELDN